jgi:hypothetical protein
MPCRAVTQQVLTYHVFTRRSEPAVSSKPHLSVSDRTMPAMPCLDLPKSARSRRPCDASSDQAITGRVIPRLTVPRHACDAVPLIA